jgi:hypothetical protein
MIARLPIIANFVKTKDAERWVYSSRDIAAKRKGQTKARTATPPVQRKTGENQRRKVMGLKPIKGCSKDVEPEKVT